MIIEESIHVAFDETNFIRPRKEILDITNTLEDMHIHEKFHKGKDDGNSIDSQSKENQTNMDLPKEWRT